MAELGACAARNDLELPDRLERDVDRRPLAANLLSEKTVRVIAAIKADVIENASLAREGDFIAVRALTTLTPGVSVSRSSNFRPRIGVVAIVVESKVLAAAVRVVSTAGASVVTVTVSETPDTFIIGLSGTVWPTVTTTFSWTSVEKPDKVKVTV